ncbi:hypothetical protein GCM10023160_05070 [Brachybacterium paraconglomeratum]
MPTMPTRGGREASAGAAAPGCSSGGEVVVMRGRSFLREGVGAEVESTGRCDRRPVAMACITARYQRRRIM